MDFEGKIISREISQLLWEREKTVATAESCTGGRIAEAIIAVPGASKYFKGGIICYVNEVKENLLGVSHDLIEEKTAVCEEVAIEMVKGACKALNGGGTKEIPVGTIWLACGTPDNVMTFKIEEDNGRDMNLTFATNKAVQMFCNFLKAEDATSEGEES